MEKLIAQTAITGMVNSLIKSNMAAGAARSDAIKLALLEVGKIMFEPKGRAMKCLGRFLQGRGDPIVFDWYDLEKEDKNVRARLHGELVRRALGMDTIKESLVKSTPLQEDNSIITIFQHTYANSDWMYALGSFDIKFEIARPTLTPRPFVNVRIWGANKYQWYSDEQRVTKRIHEVATELIKAKKAAPFFIEIKPVELTIPINSDNLLYANQGFQNNPKSGKGLLSSEQMKLARKKAEELGYASILLNSF